MKEHTPETNPTKGDSTHVEGPAHAAQGPCDGRGAHAGGEWKPHDAGGEHVVGCACTRVGAGTTTTTTPVVQGCACGGIREVEMGLRQWLKDASEAKKLIALDFGHVLVRMNVACV